MTVSYVVKAVLEYADQLTARGLVYGRPIRLDGLTPGEASRVRTALLETHPIWRVHLLGGDNRDHTGEITAERATSFRNEAASNATIPFVLLAPLGAVVEASLNEPAFYVVSRATIFREMLGRLRDDLGITRGDIQAIRESAIHNDLEAVYAFLICWDRVEGTIAPRATEEHLGLLADSGLDARTIATIKSGLRKNFDAMEILLRPGVSPARIAGELMKKVGVAADARPELDQLRAWIAVGRQGQRPTYADFHLWSIGDDGVPPPRLILNSKLDEAPHVGWSVDDDGLYANDPRGSAKLVWSIENRHSKLKVEILLVEEVTQSVVKVLGRSTGLAKTFKWAQAFGAPGIEEQLREWNPAGDWDGYWFRIRVRLLDGTTLDGDAETDAFRAEVAPGSNGKMPVPTAWHALYRFHTERATSPELVDPDLRSAVTVGLADASGKRKDIALDLSPVLVELEHRLLAIPDFAGSWSVDLSPKLAAQPELLDVVRLDDGTKNASFLQARTAFLSAVRDVGSLEAADLRRPSLRSLALAYADEWNSLAEELDRASHAGHGIANEAKLRAARLASIDSVRVRFPGDFQGDSHEVLLLSPLHPSVVTWAIAFHDLVHDWTRGTYDEAIKPPYRASLTGSAVLGGVEGFRAGPRSMVLYTAFENEVLPTAWAYSGSVHPLWQAFVRISGDVNQRGREWPESLARLLGLKDVPAGGNRIDARRVGSRLKKYAILHPYVRQLRVTALVAGDGLPLLDALRVIDEKPGTPIGALSIRELRYELQLIGPRSDRLGSAIEDLASNPGDGRWRGYASTVLDNPETVLSPGFAFGIHGIEWSSSNPTAFWPAVKKRLEGVEGGSNVVIFGSLLTTDTKLVETPAAPAGYGSRGLVSRPATVVTKVGDGEPFVGDWTLVIPRPDPYASVAAGAQHALLGLVDLAAGSVSPDYSVGLGVALAGPVSQVLRTAHDTADWVVIADPLFAVELMDRAGRDGDSLLLDYTPEFDPYPGGRVVVSTNTLGKLAQANADEDDGGTASKALTKVLSSVSARLLLSLANPTKQVVRGLHGLALTRVFFRLHLPNAVVIPMDGHADMFAVPRVTGSATLADLLAVSIIDGQLHFAVIESKWVGKANLAKKVADGIRQASASMEVLRAEFLEYPGVDRALRIDALREIILFHLQRAERHGLPLPFTRDALTAATADDELIRRARVDGHVVAWSPDIDVVSESNVDSVAVLEMGVDQIRQYFHAMGTWPDVELPDVEAVADSDLDSIYEQLIDGTIADTLKELEVDEGGGGFVLPEDVSEAESIEVVDDLEPPLDDTNSRSRLGPPPGAPLDGRGADSQVPGRTVADSAGLTGSSAQAGPEPADETPGAAPSHGDMPMPEPNSDADSRRGTAPIRLGHRVNNNEPVFWDPSKLANGHVAVLGGSGAGKTTLLRKLAGCINSLTVPVLVLDFHGDLNLPAGQYSYDFSYEGNEAFINPLHLDPAYAKDISVSRLKWEFLEAWRSQYPSLGIQQRSFLAGLVDDAYGHAGITTDPVTWTNQIDFGNVLEAFDRSSARDAVKERIEAYMQQYREWSVFHGGTPISVESMLRRSTRLNLSQLDEGARNIVADVVLRRLFLLAKALGPIPEGTTGWDRFRVYVVIDEAQVLLTSSTDAKASLAKYASEARKFGIGLVLATQLRDNIPGNVWGNVDTRLWMLALDQGERQKNAKAAGIEESSLAALQVGEAFLVASSQPGQRPVRLKIDRDGC